MVLATVAQETMNGPSKLVLCVIDAMAPAMLERATQEGAAPTLSTLMRRGHYVNDCVAAFPSVTPVCAASLLTGTWQERHRIPGMNWYGRERELYVEYGSSLRAAQRFGITRQLTDTVYNLNQVHLAPEVPTVFETLDDADVRTACTTYLVFRGRHLHEPRRDGLLTRLASPIMRYPVLGPLELFYADIFSSSPAPCTALLGMPGIRDRHAGCVGSYLVEHQSFDLLLLSLPDNDWYSHKYGPDAQVRSLAQADLQLTRLADAAGGLDELLGESAIVVVGDHSQAPVAHAIDLIGALSDFGIAGPRDVSLQGSRLAVCPSQRAAMVYLLDENEREELRRSVISRAVEMDGVELVCWLERDERGAPLEAVVTRAGGAELRFAPGGERLDRRGSSWRVEGALEALGIEVCDDGVLEAAPYPDGLARLWSALTCSNSGDVLLSAAPEYEFADWGGQAHVGGGSHGSLRAEDSLTALIACGVEIPREEPSQWSICDVAPMVTAHFGLEPRVPPLAGPAMSGTGAGS
jgi:Type I phosphodiesterase / nucleotide pyrophosphatase